MRKIILMAVAAFAWKQLKARIAPANVTSSATPSAKAMGPSGSYGGRR